jgi:biopolymer transport protein ExbB/TolQ
MANEIKKEFETYVKNITESIAKEIYLEDLKELCDVYKNQLASCKDLYAKHTDLDKEIITKIEKNVDYLNSIEKTVGDKLQNINDQQKKFETEYEELLRQYEDRISAKNSDLRKAFMDDFTKVGNELNAEMKKDLEEEHELLKKTLQKVITPQNLQDYMDKMESSVQVLNKSLQVLDSGYEEIFERYAKKVDSHSQDQIQKVQDSIRKVMQDGIEDMHKKLLDLQVEQHEQLLERATEKKDFECLRLEMAVMSDHMNRMQVSYNENLNKLFVEIKRAENLRYRNDHERRRERRYLNYLMISNSVSMIVILLLVGYAQFGAKSNIGNISSAVVAVVTVLGTIVASVKMKKRSAYDAAKRKAATEQPVEGLQIGLERDVAPAMNANVEAEEKSLEEKSLEEKTVNNKKQHPKKKNNK